MDKLVLKNMKFWGYTGCLPEEKVEGQNFLVTIEMLFDRNPGAVTDKLEDTVNYAELYELIKAFVTTSKGNLIENLAYEIGGIVLNYTTLVDRVFVTVSKPDAPVEGDFETMETTIERKRCQASKMTHSATLSMGSNMGNREEYLREATRKLMESGHIEVIKKSGLYETEPVGYDNQSYFYNVCIEVITDLGPYELLDLIHDTENDLHRVRTIKNGPRTIDIDILLYDDLKMDDEDLIIPHPRMYERAFVLLPLKDIRDYDGVVPEDKSVEFVGPFEV